MNAGESVNSSAVAPKFKEFRTEIDENNRENEEIDNESGDLNSQDGEEDDKEGEFSPNHLDYAQIDIIGIHIDPRIINLILKPNMERFFRNWEHGSFVFFRFIERTWKIQIEWKVGRCMFGKGWYDFARETELAVGDSLVMYKISNVENIFNVRIFKGGDYIDDVGEDTEKEEEFEDLGDDNVMDAAVVNNELRESSASLLKCHVDNKSREMIEKTVTGDSPESQNPTTSTMNAGESVNSGAAAAEYRAEIDENEEIDNESGDLNSQDGEEDDEEAEFSPKLAEGFYEIETVRRKRVRKGQVQYLIKWRGWPETANTWEPYENLVSCFDVIEAFEEGLRSGKHRSRKRKRRSSGLVPQAKKKTQGTPGASTSAPLSAGRVKFDEGNYIIPFVGDVSHEDGGRSEMGGIGDDDAVGQGNGHESIVIPPQVEEKDGYETDVNLGECTGTKLTNGGSSLLAINNLNSQILFENGLQKVDGEGLVQANVRLRKRRKASSVKRFSQEQTSQSSRVTNCAAIEKGDGNESVDIPPPAEECRDHYEMDVNPCEFPGTPLINWGSNRVADDMLKSKISEAICFENGHQSVDGVGLVQGNDRLRNRKKAASVKRFSQEQTPRVANYAAIEQENGTESVDIFPQVEEGRDLNELDVNPGEYAGTPFINGGSSRVAVNILESKSSEAICFENGHQKVDREGLVQANGRSRNRRKAASVKRFSQEQNPRVTNYAAIEQGNENGNESVDIPPQFEEGRDHFEMEVNPGEYAGTPFTNGGSSRVAVNILQLKTSESICIKNGRQTLDGERLVQGNNRLKNRRKAASVKRFNQEQTPCVTNYAAQDLTTKNTRASGIAGQNWDKSSVQRSKSDSSTDTFSITEIIKPINFSSSGSISDILVTFMAKRSDGKEVMVDNKYLKANYPLLLINYYEQHLNYNAAAGPDRSGREYMAG